MRFPWRFIGWMIADVPSALRRSVWAAVIAGLFGRVLKKITERSERAAQRVAGAFA